MKPGGYRDIGSLTENAGRQRGDARHVRPAAGRRSAVLRAPRHVERPIRGQWRVREVRHGAADSAAHASAAAPSIS